jgi:hypothetical protein
LIGEESAVPLNPGNNRYGTATAAGPKKTVVARLGIFEQQHNLGRLGIAHSTLKIDKRTSNLV